MGLEVFDDYEVEGQLDMNLQIMYDKNKDFNEYVDRYAKNYNEGKSISVAEALTHKLVKNYAEWLQRKW